jgi:DNA-binding CsgD family transcriptional regulator
MLRLLADNKTPPEIAEIMESSLEATQSDIANVLALFRADSPGQAVAIAIQQRLIGPFPSSRG